ncbi:MAG: hypothetical protein QOE31_928, partial [Solirubrobacteraceae bacterium]|nr:hypothetical protein [Solirubrobacteraceae bacterium]
MKREKASADMATGSCVRVAEGVCRDVGAVNQGRVVSGGSETPMP